MSANSENSKEKVEGAVATEKAANDANKEEEKADLVSHCVLTLPSFFCRLKKELQEWHLASSLSIITTALYGVPFFEAQFFQILIIPVQPSQKFSIRY